MRTRQRGRVAVVAVGLAVVALGVVPATAASAAPSEPAAQTGIVAQLKSLPGVTYLGTNAHAPNGYRVFELEIKQPVDHSVSGGPTFEQRLELYHRNVTAPMVMFVPGYFKYTYLDPTLTYLSDAAAIVGGNQLTVEHRFFGNSVERPAQWSTLTIAQDAADEHHIVKVFRSLYTANWLITGISKGGETAVFHDYYYPHDFVGTFAWSAPSITHTFNDGYDQFLDSVGTASCRSSLLEAQRLALQHRGRLENDIASAAAAARQTFDFWPHGLDEAFEQTVLFTPFVFWQYGGNCATIPSRSATTQQLYDWYDAVVGWLGVSDQAGAPYQPYNFQAGTQLGYPLVHEKAQLGHLLHYPLSAEYPEEDMTPNIPRQALDQSLMRAVHGWVKNHGSRLLFLYGQRDPFSAQRFELGPGSSDSAIYVIPNGAHTTPYTALPAVQRTAFVHTLQQWAGVATTSVAGTRRPARPFGLEWSLRTAGGQPRSTT
jgi:hypothetical protein